MPNKIVAVTDSVFPNLDAAARGGGEGRGRAALGEGADAGGDPGSRPGCGRDPLHLREGHDRGGRAIDALPHHLAVRHRRGQRGHRHGHEQGNRRHEGSGLLHRRSVGSRDGAAAGDCPQDSVLEFGSAGGRWEMPAVVPIHRLRGTMLGLVGFGRIPQLVAPKAQAFGMNVIAFDPFVPQGRFRQSGRGARGASTNW